MKEILNFDYIQYVETGKEGLYGGSVSLADYCPYIQEFTWRSNNVIVRGSHCQYVENNPSKLLKMSRKFIRGLISLYYFIVLNW
ncbi:hypothetical protein NQ314_007917 [Rhamnusium bicolor]|uniref:Uncharacterized protein n=1 Tax=Rhamnusium bicolor TaxID=1586634 RepID=A0AAV8YFD0_9CUCU|nr:hypothetical protein NQ314_007917 [Rhamnusium bicolor]